MKYAQNLISNTTILRKSPMQPRAMLVMMSLAVPLLAHAGVDPKNGTFFITYSDISLKNNGHELEITRTYNSKSAEVGWFGYGWGSRYETRLIVLPDGSAVIKENGSGRTTYYRTKSESAIKTGIKRIVEASTQRENLTPAAANELATKLLGDEELRLSKVIKYDIHTELPKGAALDDFCGKAALTRVTEGYQRNDCNRFGDTEPATDTFDMEGRLIRHALTDGYAVTIRYADAGNAEIRDTLEQSIALGWTPEGRVGSSRTSKTEVKYTYANQDLVKVATTDGNTYRHDYDANHNMTRITYIDDSSMFISYSPRVNGMADAVTERNGDQQTFAYRTDPANANHYWTKHTIISNTGRTASKEYEYNNQVSPVGVVNPARTTQTMGDNSVETKYDGQGRKIRQADQSGGFVEFSYHPTLNKITEVRNGQLTVKYRYDAAGNLTRAEDDKGQQFDLAYGGKGEIRQLIENNRAEHVHRELSIEHDGSNHPVQMTMKGIGSIRVQYDSQGNISEVKQQLDNNQPAKRETLGLQISDMMDKLKTLAKQSETELRL
ncbi:MAG: DUF6531 domain-containing protein [Methylotenera sp.]